MTNDVNLVLFHVKLFCSSLNFRNFWPMYVQLLISTWPLGLNIYIIHQSKEYGLMYELKKISRKSSLKKRATREAEPHLVIYPIS